MRGDIITSHVGVVRPHIIAAIPDWVIMTTRTIQGLRNALTSQSSLQSYLNIGFRIRLMGEFSI